MTRFYGKGCDVQEKMVKRNGMIRVACCIAAFMAPLWAHAAPADGVAFDGSECFTASAEDIAWNPTGLTVAAWVQLGEEGASQVFLNRGRANTLFTFYRHTDGVRMLVNHAEGAYRQATAPPAAPGVWAHYTGVYDGATIRLYVNGTEAAAAEAPGRIADSREPLFIGALDERQRALTGRMDDIRMWSRALAPEEVAALAAGNSPPAIARGLTACWSAASLEGDTWKNEAPDGPDAARIEKGDILVNRKEDGYRGIWYFNQPSNDEYVYKYSGGLGTYCANHAPFAIYVEQVDKTFFTYGGAYKDKNTLIHMVSYFDHKTGMVPRPTFLLDKQTDDAHDNPVISMDSDGHIWIFSSSHGTARASYISKSREPFSVDAFDLVWEGNFSYPQPWYFPGRGWVFMHTFYADGRTICEMTSPNGRDWSERRILSRMDQGHYQVSYPFRDVKVGTSFNYHPKGLGLNYRTNIYYMESSDFGQTWTTVDGQPLEPILTDPKSPAMAHEYESEGLKVYTIDLNYDSRGNPILLYITSKGYESGPENMPRTWTTARWTGSEWDVQGGDIISDNNYDFGSLYIESDEVWRIIGPTEVGPQAYNPGGEIAMWITRNQGRNWERVRQMTRNSAYNHTYVRRPMNAHPDFYGYWADGHGRQPSESRLYFCNRDGDVFRLPFDMDGEFAVPERVE